MSGVVALVGILVALAIAAIVASPRLQELLGIGTHEGHQPTPERLTRLRLIALSDAVKDYTVQFGRRPASLEALLEVQAESNNRRPRQEWFVDGWGVNIRLQVDGQDYVLRSNGPDRLPDTHDDLKEAGS